jgi:hypothetical protein
MPERIQRKRIKGWKMPANTVYVGRPTPFGNPFHAGLYKNFTAAGAGPESLAMLMFCLKLLIRKIKRWPQTLNGRKKPGTRQ